MEIARLTPKGRVSIPEQLRRDFQSGTAFEVERHDNTILLKKVDELDQTLKASYVKKIRTIEQLGKFTSYDSFEALERELENA